VEAVTYTEARSVQAAQPVQMGGQAFPSRATVPGSRLFDDPANRRAARPAEADVTAPLLDVRPVARVAPPEMQIGDLILAARSHQPAEGEVCRRCGWHWPCPRYFSARYALIQAHIPPAVWA
jgi:hypothetical protein